MRPKTTSGPLFGQSFLENYDKKSKFSVKKGFEEEGATPHLCGIVSVRFEFECCSLPLVEKTDFLKFNL